MAKQRISDGCLFAILMAVALLGWLIYSEYSRQTELERKAADAVMRRAGRR